MSFTTYKTPSTRRTPQSESIPGTAQVKNSAGGFVYAVDPWGQLDRFLVLGTAGGSYYVGERALTKENAACVTACLDADGLRAVRAIVDVSQAGRAVSNDPAIFALAMAAGHADGATRQTALLHLSDVCRIPTHLFHFNEYVRQFRGRGRALNRAVSAWYTETPVDKLAYHMAKYRQRDGWSHRDLLRLTKPKTDDPTRGALFRWACRGEPIPEGLPSVVAEVQSATGSALTGLITEHSLTWEMVPSEALKRSEVWEALLPHMPLTALLRNMGRMTSNGLLAPLSNAVSTAVGKITDSKALKKARVHPLSVLVALKTYSQGHGMRGSLTWEPVSAVTDALDEAFYLSFDAVVPTGKRHMLAIDVSGSMTWSNIAGLPITCAEAASCLAMVTHRIEPSTAVGVFSTTFQFVDLSSRKRLDDVVRCLYDNGMSFGGTDCAMPMIRAQRDRLDVDAFCVYTDNETWAGVIHPSQALTEYREHHVSDAALVVAGMVSNGFTIADPSDSRMLDVVGFDTATPAAMSAFLSI